jgi:hypothetical protein
VIFCSYWFRVLPDLFIHCELTFSLILLLSNIASLSSCLLTLHEDISPLRRANFSEIPFSELLCDPPSNFRLWRQ